MTWNRDLQYSMGNMTLSLIIAILLKNYIDDLIGVGQSK